MQSKLQAILKLLKFRITICAAGAIDRRRCLGGMLLGNPDQGQPQDRPEGIRNTMWQQPARRVQTPNLEAQSEDGARSIECRV